MYEQRLKKIKSVKNNILIIHLNYENKLFKNDLDSQKYFIQQVNNLVNLGSKVIFIYPLPQMKLHISNELSKKFRLEEKEITTYLGNKENFISIDYNEFKKKSEYIKDILDSLNHASIFRINVEDIFCNTIIKNKCIAHNDKNLFFVDNNHLSNFSSKKISKELLSIVNKIN